MASAKELYDLALENNGTIIKEGRSYLILLPSICEGRIYLGDTFTRAITNLKNILNRAIQGEEYFQQVMKDPAWLATLEKDVLQELKSGYHFQEYVFTLGRLPEARRIEFLDRLESEGKVYVKLDPEFGKMWIHMNFAPVYDVGEKVTIHDFTVFADGAYGVIIGREWQNCGKQGRWVYEIDAYNRNQARGYYQNNDLIYKLPAAFLDSGWTI